MSRTSPWEAVLEAMEWDNTDAETATPYKGNGKRPPPMPVRPKRSAPSSKGRPLPGVSTEGVDDFENMGWNIRNKKTGQVFTHIPGRTPMDAKKQVLATNPLLHGLTPLDFEADPMPDGGTRADQNRTPMSRAQQTQAPAQGTPPPQAQTSPGRGARYTRNEPYSFDDDETTSANPPRPETPSSGAATGQYRRPNPNPRGRSNATGFQGSVRVNDTDVDVPEVPSLARRRARGEGAGAGAMGANGPMGRDAQKEAFKEAVRAMVREVVRKKAGGGGYALYAPNKGKKKSPKPVGEFPTRLAAKNAELARFPPKDPEQLKKTRARLEKIKKDPKKRAAAEKADLSGRKRPKKTGAPAGERKKRKESLVRLMTQDLYERLFHEAGFGLGKSGDPKHRQDPEDSPIQQGNHYPRSAAYDKGTPDRNPKKSRRDHMVGKPVTERLFHEDEVPGSPWDERITALHPDAISSDRKLHALHRGMEKASIGALGDAHKGLSKVLRGMVKVNPGDISFDGERKKTFMPVMLDCDGMEIGPVHLYVDGGHIKIEVSKDAREAIAQLEPDAARDIRGGLMSFEEDHLPKIDGAQKAWRDRDNYLDKLHGRLEKHASGLSGVEHHLMKGLLTKGGKRK